MLSVTSLPHRKDVWADESSDIVMVHFANMGDSNLARQEVGLVVSHDMDAVSDERCRALISKIHHNDDCDESEQKIEVSVLI